MNYLGMHNLCFWLNNFLFSLKGHTMLPVVEDESLNYSWLVRAYNSNVWMNLYRIDPIGEAPAGV